MRNIVLMVAFLISSMALAGGQIGGGSGGQAQVDLIDFNNGFSSGVVGIVDPRGLINELPKKYIDESVFTRTRMRLSLSQNPKVSLNIDGQNIEVMKFSESIVDVNLSSELLPENVK